MKLPGIVGRRGMRIFPRPQAFRGIRIAAPSASFLGYDPLFCQKLGLGSGIRASMRLLLLNFGGGIWK